MFIYTENTQNPINALKISICYTEQSKNSKIHLKNPRFRKIKNKNKINKNHFLELLVYYISNYHNSYVVYFIYIYTYTCRSLTCVGPLHVKLQKMRSGAAARAARRSRIRMRQHIPPQHVAFTALLAVNATWGSSILRTGVHAALEPRCSLK